MSLEGNARLRTFRFAGPPVSGTAGSFAGEEGLAGSLLWDTANGVLYMNEGSQASPYWSPAGYDQAPLFGIWTDFRNQAGKAIADTAAEAILAGSGLRVFGQGIAETDSGLVPQAAGEGGVVARMTTTDEDAHLCAIGSEAGIYQPDQHKRLVVDVELTNVTAITARALFVGFLGTATDALDPAVTGATTVATLVQDDLAGLWMDAGLTDPDRIFGVHNKSDEAATQNLVTDGDTGIDMAAAGTFQRFRVEIGSNGAMLGFVNKAQVYSRAAALDVDEECAPVVYIESQAAAIKEADVRRFATWAYRP